MRSPGQVHILDDNSDFRDSLAALVESFGYETVCHPTGAAYLKADVQDIAHCLILDLEMPDRHGLSVLAELAKRPIVPPVIVLTGHASVPSVVKSFQSGNLVEFFQKHALNELALLEAIQQSMERSISQLAIHTQREEMQSRLRRLSEPELQVLDMLLDGAEHFRISQQLQVSRRTVENRRARIMRKLDVTTFPALIQLLSTAGFERGK